MSTCISQTQDEDEQSSLGCCNNQLVELVDGGGGSLTDRDSLSLRFLFFVSTYLTSVTVAGISTQFNFSMSY